jgi:hypothetical protein
MPYFFAGKFSHERRSYADNELWIVLFPGHLTSDSDSPVIVVCQWTETANGQKKHNDVWKGKVTRVDGDNIEIFKNDSNLYYWYVVHTRTFTVRP